MVDTNDASCLVRGGGVRMAVVKKREKPSRTRPAKRHSHTHSLIHRSHSQKCERTGIEQGAAGEPMDAAAIMHETVCT